MKEFLREFWLWILIPVLIVAGGILLLVFLSGGSDATSPFVYNVF